MKKRNSLRLISGLFSALWITTVSLSAHAVSREISVPLANLGSPKIQLSVPDAAVATGANLPVIFLVSGFQTSRQLAPILSGAAGNNIVVVFEYPLEDKSDWTSWNRPEDVQAAQSLSTIPLQIVGVLNWIRGPALTMQYGVTADLHRINTVAISLGILFLPSALRLDQMQGHEVNSIVFAYAGAKLNVVAQQQAQNNGLGSFGQILNQAAAVLSAPFEPENYVRDLRAKQFLILNADNDQIFPPESQRALVAATPAPCDVISIPGLHIGLNQPERVLSSLMLLKNWLIAKQAVNN